MDEDCSGEGASTQPTGGRVESTPMGRARILLVDDNADSLCLLELFLQGRGFEVTTAEDVDSACAKVEQALPDLIITDFIMPRHTGIDLCRRLRSRRRTRHIPIILHTASDIAEIHSGLFDALAAKPVDWQVLGKTVSRLLTSGTRMLSTGSMLRRYDRVLYDSSPTASSSAASASR